MRFNPTPFKAAALLALTAVLIPAFAQAAGPPAGPTPQQIAQRQQIAKRQLLARPVSLPKATGADLASAIDVDPARLVSSTVLGPQGSNAALADLGVIRPIRGSSFAVLSSGILGATPEPGVDFAPEGTPGDEASLTIVLQVPQGASRLSFDFNFLSAEYPDFIGSSFNDTFIAALSDANGTQVIAQASVNSSFFFPASSSRAGGSGFDIFTEDPTEVDTIFGNGLPDAGVTDFQSVDVPVQSNGTITLTFSIEDQGDGILDSAVILDNLEVAAIEAVDANSQYGQFLVGGRVTENPETVARGGEPRRGLVADGVSRLILRSAVAGPGSVEWCLASGSAPADGGLDELGGEDRRACVTTPAVQTTAGFQAFAMYRAPDEFNRGGDESLERRPVRIRSSHNGGSSSEIELQVLRPPVILVHGLWSEPSSWKLPLAGDGRFLVRSADYKSSNAVRFAANGQVVRREIQDVLHVLRQQEYAATQVDVVGHSMGGLLSRIWTAAGDYRRNENFQQGDVHKLVTVDSPHSGSPLADLLANVRDIPFVGSWVKEQFAEKGMPIDQGAIDDLRKGSPALRSMGASPIPVHAVIGKGGSDLVGGAIQIGGQALSNLPGWAGLLFKTLSFVGTVQQLHPGIQHDIIVGRPSQEGGLPAAAVTVVGGGDGIHIEIPTVAVGNTGSPIISNRVVDLLNSDAQGPEFSTLPAGSTLGASQDIAHDLGYSFQPYASRSIQPGVRIVSPAPGTTVAPGQTIEVVVEPTSGANVQRVLVLGTDAAAIDEQPPFRLQLTVPANLSGDFPLSALGANATGDYFTGDSVHLRVRPTADLLKLDLKPDDVVLIGTGSTRPMTTVGEYADGIVRDLTDPVTGTLYQSVNSSIVSVSSAGQITARSLGTTTIVARNGEDQDSITVRVLEGPPPCQPGSDRLCLGQNRFRVQVDWTDFQGNRGLARPVSFQSADSGLLWFFDSENWEMMVKVIDGCGLNGHFWVFAAATTNVGYTLTVTDTQTGDSRSYSNPLGQASPAVTDTSAFGSCPASSASVATAAKAPAAPEAAKDTSTPAVAPAAKAVCTPAPGNLCLSGRRFRIEVSWRDFQGKTGTGTVVPFGSDDSGLFWFFDNDNWEMLVKVVDGCALNNRLWVFSAALTNVEYTLRVTDTVTGQVKEYRNPLGTASRAIADTSTFSCS